MTHVDVLFDAAKFNSKGIDFFLLKCFLTKNCQQRSICECLEISNLHCQCSYVNSISFKDGMLEVQQVRKYFC